MKRLAAWFKQQRAWVWIKKHPVLLLLTPVEAFSFATLFLSISNGSEAVVQIALATLGATIVLIKVGLAGDKTAVGFSLWLIASIMSAYAHVSFITSHASSDIDIPDTIEVRSAKRQVDKYEQAIKYSETEIGKAIKENRLSLLRDTLNPQLDEDQIHLDEAQKNYDKIVNTVLSLPPDAITVLTRPVQLVMRGNYGSIALLTFAIMMAVFVEGVTLRSMRGPKRKITTTKRGYPLDEEGNLLMPNVAAKKLGIPVSGAVALYAAEKEEGYK